MTSVIVFRKSDCAAILSDAASYDADGLVQGFGVKCFPLPHLRAAIATRGSSLVTSLFAANFGFAFQTFDDLAENGGAIAREWFDSFSELMTSGETEVQMFLVGWSEKEGHPKTFLLQSMADNQFGIDPWVFQECDDDVLAAPLPSEADLLAQGLDLNMDPAAADACNHGLKIMEAQRRMRLGTVTGRHDVSAHIVGGFALLTEIDRDGVHQRVVHRWPEDRIGHKISPFPAVAATLLKRSPDRPYQQKTRQQQRASERHSLKERAF